MPTPPTWVSAGTPASGTGDVTPGLPPGWAENDVFLLFIEFDSTDNPTISVSGWTQIGTTQRVTSAVATKTGQAAFYRRATSSESAPTVTDTGDHTFAIIHAFRGCNPVGSPINTSFGNWTGTESTSVFPNSVTTTVDNCLIVLSVTHGADISTANFSGWTNSNLTGVTERSDDSTTDGSGGGIGVATGVMATAGATGSSSATLATSSAKAYFTIALTPDGGVTDFALGSDPIALKLVIGKTDILGMADTTNVLDLEPTIGMSRPFTYDVGWKDIINKIETTSEKRYDFPEEIVWEEATPQIIVTGESYTYKAQAGDPFLDAQIPIAGIKSYTLDQQTITPSVYDFIVEGGSVGVSISRTSGQSLDIVVTNTSGATVTVSNMTLRAKPVRVYKSFSLKDEDKDSQTKEGVKTPSGEEQPSTWANVNDAKAIMEIILNQRFRKLPFINFNIVNANDVRLRTQLDMRLSDRIDVTETETFTDHDFYIENIGHTISKSGTYHETMVGCEQIPTRIENVFTFDDSSLGFDNGVFGDRSSLYDFDNNLFILGQSTLDGAKVLGL